MKKVYDWNDRGLSINYTLHLIENFGSVNSLAVQQICLVLGQIPHSLVQQPLCFGELTLAVGLDVAHVWVLRLLFSCFQVQVT